MKKEKSPKNVNRNLRRALTFFLFIPLLSNLIGNFIGISSHYTFYYYGYNSVAIISRLLEDTITNVGWRIFTLGMLTMITSALMYLLYAKAKKGKLYAFIIGFVLYAVDFSLVFSIHYYEGATGIIVSNFIHLMILLYFVVVGLLFLLKNPRWRTRYDYA